MSLERIKTELKLQIAKLESEASKLKKALNLLGEGKSSENGAKDRKPLTIAGRKKIAEAQKRRWSKFHSAKKGK